MSELARGFDASGPLSIQGWMMIGRDREIPELLPMPPGIHLNLGEGRRPIGDAVPFDREHGWDAESEPLRAAGPDSIAGIWAHAFFDYISQDRIMPLFRECHRVLQVGGVMNIVGPHGNSDLWNEDVLRKTRFTEESWRNMFQNPWYDAQSGHEPIGFEVHACFIMGVKWRNLSLFTQLVKR